MNILVLNGSPKGKASATLHTALYLEALHPEHTFEYLPVGVRIKSYEKDFAPARAALEKADLVLFCYPVYTFLAPYQLHRFVELMKENGPDLAGKFASQITTSKHFYDVTAHRWVEENCFDLGMKPVRGLSADMEDLLSEKGRRQARDFFDQLVFACEHGLFVTPPPAACAPARPAYRAALPETPKTGDKDVVIVTDCAPENAGLAAMIADFRVALPHASRVINLRDFPFAGGCLGCMNCAVTGKCVYKDGFDDFLRGTVQTADAFVYAFAVSGHSAGSLFKCYDDRQFCNGHRAVTQGKPVAYLVQGDYRNEPNLRMVLEARAEVGGNYLAGVATDEADTAADIAALAANLAFALEKGLSRPANFYGVGGSKIFRDLIYVMRGMMKADHKFYKAHGAYDFPQKQKKRILQMQLVGALLAVPAVQKQAKGKMTEAIVGPYRKVVEAAKAEAEKGAKQ